MKPYGRKYSKRCKNRRWAEQSQALAAIDWQAANINQIDAAHAADYTRFHIERQILDGMELGDTQGKQIQQTAQTANAWAYRGVDGKSPTEDIITGQRADGKAYVVLSGNLDTEGPDGTLFVLDTETARRHRSTGGVRELQQARPLRSSRQNSYKSPNSRPQRNTRSVNSDRTWRSAPKRA